MSYIKSDYKFKTALVDARLNPEEINCFQEEEFKYLNAARILEDDDIGILTYPVGFHLQENIPLINYMIRNLEEHLEDYNLDNSDLCFVSQGSSGSIVSALIASYFSGSIIWDIKKPGQTSHSHHTSIQPDNLKYLIFVDDFISEGCTFHRCYEEVKKCGLLIDCVLVSGTVSFTVFEEHPVCVIICQEYFQNSIDCLL